MYNFEIEKIHDTVWVFKKAIKNPQDFVEYFKSTREWRDWYTFGTVADGSGLQIGGLPFTSGGTANDAFGVGVINYQFSFNTNDGDTLEVNQNSTILAFYTNTGANRLGNAANVNINDDIIFNVFYISA
jgi:hypothetical protein